MSPSQLWQPGCSTAGQARVARNIEVPSAQAVTHASSVADTTRNCTLNRQHGADVVRSPTSAEERPDPVGHRQRQRSSDSDPQCATGARGPTKCCSRDTKCNQCHERDGGDNGSVRRCRNQRSRTEREDGSRSETRGGSNCGLEGLC